MRALLADWNSGGSKSVFGRIRGILEQDSQLFLCKICSQNKEIWEIHSLDLLMFKNEERRGYFAFTLNIFQLSSSAAAAWRG